MTVSLNGTTGVTFPDASVQNTAATGFGFKNRIINGAMVIDQRNAGAAVTVNSGTDYFPVDRFLAVGTSSAGVFTVQRSSTAPTGFINSLLATVTTVDSSLGTTDQYYTSQIIEGLNVSDLAWGTANAATVTLSFWVRSSVTGTFGGSIRNSATDRSYAFTYTISSANTFEYKTVTIAGDQSGTWLTTNGVGMHIIWQFGLGSDRVTSAGAWTAGNYKGASGVTNLMATSGATFYITGVQLEKGSTATSFDYRPYGTELALCQRYLPAFTGRGTFFGFGIGASSTTAYCTAVFPVAARTAPSGITVSSASHFNVSDVITINSAASTVAFADGGLNSGLLVMTVASGITTGRPTTLYSNSASANLYFTGCEL
jgi:hypothetical protein